MYKKETVFGVLGSMDKPHNFKKKELGGRVQIARILVQRFYGYKRDQCSDAEYVANCEAVLDGLLLRFDYDIEFIIGKWRAIVPPPAYTACVCETCGYGAPFCGYLWGDGCSSVVNKV